MYPIRIYIYNRLHEYTPNESSYLRQTILLLLLLLLLLLFVGEVLQCQGLRCMFINHAISGMFHFHVYQLDKITNDVCL